MREESKYLTEPVIARDEMAKLQTDMEAKHEIVSLDYLQERRRQLMRRFAPLKAKYGPFGVAEKQHDALVAAVALTIDHDQDPTDELDPPRPVKITEEVRKAWARSHPKVERSLHRLLEGRADYLVAEVELTEIEEQIRNREIMAGLTKSEMYLK